MKDKFDALNYILSKQDATTILIDFVSSLDDYDAMIFIDMLFDMVGFDLHEFLEFNTESGEIQ